MNIERCEAKKKYEKKNSIANKKTCALSNTETPTTIKTISKATKYTLKGEVKYFKIYFILYDEVCDVKYTENINTNHIHGHKWNLLYRYDIE